MRSRTITAWYCDHCSRRNFTRPAMTRHELSCTANPSRSCHICTGDPQTEAAGLHALIAFCKERAAKSHDGMVLTKSDVDELRELCDGCPACMLAAVRQTKVYAVDWDAKAEFKTFWDAFRKEQSDEFSAMVGGGFYS